MKKLNIKRIKNKKGITLVALVVTIVVLLILAGVSLNLLIYKYSRRDIKFKFMFFLPS